MWRPEVLSFNMRPRDWTQVIEHAGEHLPPPRPFTSLALALGFGSIIIQTYHWIPMVRVLGGRMMPPSRMKKRESLSSCFQQGHQTPSVSPNCPLALEGWPEITEWKNHTGTPGIQGRWCHRDSRHSGVSSMLTWKPGSGDGVFCSLSLTSFFKPHP